MLSGLAYWADAAVDASLKRQLRSQLEIQRDSSAAAIELWIGGILPQLKSVADSRPVLEALAAKKPIKNIDGLLSRLGASAYLVTDASGVVVDGSAGVQLGRSLPLPEAKWQKWLAAPAPRVWPPVPYAAGAEHAANPYFTFSAPVTQGSRTLGALHFLVDPRARFSETLGVGRPGASGETYAFDSRGRMISASRFKDQLIAVGLLPKGAESSILALDIRDPGVALPEGKQAALPRQQQPLTQMARSALSSGRGSNVDGYNDYRGVPVVGAWDYFPTHDFGIAAEVDVAEAFQLRSGIRTVLGVLLVVMCISLLLAVWVGHRNLELHNRSERAEKQAQRLGQYTLGRKLGEGGMGAVYEAHHAMLRRPTAIKLIKPPESGEVPEAALARFEREVQMTAALTHANTISIYDYGKTPDGVFYYAMEYLSGIDLEKLVERTGPLPPSRAVHLLIQACGSLAEAHDQGLIHRDIKPSNLMVCERGGEYDRVKVLDFGLVKTTEREGEASLTAVGAITGTPHYMAPESLKGEETTLKSDIYALGAVLYFALSGRDLFPGREAMAILVAHMTETPEALGSVAPAVPAALARVVHRCLEKDPNQRPENARQLAEQLEATGLCDWNREKARQWWAAHESLAPAPPVRVSEVRDLDPEAATIEAQMPKGA